MASKCKNSIELKIDDKINNFDFTNPQNSLGCVYVVRDPRNVITSLKNHYQLDDNQAFDWITQEKKFI